MRSYRVRDGHHFLSPMADGGIYEFEPAGGSRLQNSPEGRVTEGSDITSTALRPGAIVEVKLLDISRADAPSITIAEQTIQPKDR